MKKLIKDGKVAVLISPGYGGGWSTWAYGDSDELLFDPVIAKMVLDHADVDDIEAVARVRYPNEHLSGIEDLEVQWVDQGKEFIVEEYDGAESIRYKDGIIWSVA
jgi:hypothetical protein